MLLDETPLPDGADKEDEWEKKIHQLIGDEDDTEGDNNKPYHDERTVDAEGTFYLRLGRGGEPIVRAQPAPFTVGQAIPVCEGKRVAFFSTGAIFDEVSGAMELLRQEGVEA